MRQRHSAAWNLLLSIVITTMVFILRLDVFALENNYTDLSICYDPDQCHGADGTRFWLYRIEPDSNPVRFQAGGSDSEALDAAALAKEYADTEPAYTAVIHEGTGVIENIPEGIYLLTGDETTVDKTVYTPTPAVLNISRETEDGEMTVYVKYIKTIKSQSSETAVYTVIKRWAGDNESLRPEEITVSIIEDGMTINTIILNKDNDWKYQWQGDIGKTYQIIEQNIPDGYTLVQTGTKTTFILTNTYQTDTPLPADTPAASDKPAVPFTMDSFSAHQWIGILGESLLLAGVIGILLRESS